MTIEATLAQFIDSHHAEQIEFLRQIVRVPSDTPPGHNNPPAEKAAELLTAKGYNVERFAVPEQRVRDYGMQSITNLIVRQKFGTGTGPTIALNAHGDVVPPGEGWSFDPYGGEVRDGRMYARGVAVSKSDIAGFTFALDALKAAERAGAKLNGNVELHLTYDEEFGGLAGPGYLLEQKATKPDYVIGASFSYTIVTAHNGCLQFEVTVHGTATHGSMPETGHDALQAANAILNAIYGKLPDLAKIKSKVPGINTPTMLVGQIAGGTNTNVVPGKVVMKMDRRLIPEENPAEVEAQVRAMIEGAVAGRTGIRVEIKRILLANALKPLPGNAKLVAALQKHGERIMGEPIPAIGVPLYTDARLYGEAGIPVVLYGAGPRTVPESNAKRADENLLLEDLRKATQVVACAVADLLS
ncbi:MAG TPA: ArgE/DapE family deacylase [Casimicrobium huifangae]|jgi:acetylornithine deacetylase/succinyl-diaminopimelate desuccinylase family protein|uniref:ArgE/DapE family deacylase n=1 Tax=Casimicrobium huifangae TaxID=2591109 RepID=UPI0012EC8755|nr:ArgE/DapE family deacylase [Casimicrobium huifangae]HOB00719.1 ArgE/DapE family deacylase [Casimicrobium huifangae]HQA33712.1 ArgE/DapE family deacylase [Casimicrobium huifangae]HQD64037.1 ArgE/DapE family deacylase [Casimicrobium huifangae]